MGEVFVDISGYAGDYKVSNLGNVISCKRGKETPLKPMIATNGYPTACLWKSNKQKKIPIHRLVAIAFVDNPNGYDEVNHKDENKLNNRADNLEWCDRKYNMSYGKIKEKMSAAKKGKAPWNKGKRCPSITAAQTGKPHPHKGKTNQKEN